MYSAPGIETVQPLVKKPLGIFFSKKGATCVYQDKATG